jgi:DNA-binding HxlR family transcriptional regulator
MRCRSCQPVPEQVRRVADLLERRWTVSIIVASHGGAVRFNEFLQMIGRVPPATLASRLTALEEAGNLERQVHPGRPPLVEYRLTPRGEKLRALVKALKEFSEVSEPTPTR